MSAVARAERDLLYDIADVLLPATVTMPALRDADADGLWLDRACAARTDLLPIIGRVRGALAGTSDLPTALRDLHHDDRATFDALANVVAGAYYMIPRVRELIGYPGQVRNPAPLEQAADELSDEIFEAAMGYTGSYRSAPA